ncbi:efflux RND transporter periplasmic adaptor subunit [Methylolobus aquaticus]
MSGPGRRRKLIAPLLVLALGATAAYAIITRHRDLETEAAAEPPPVVQIQIVQPETVRLSVQSQGTVVPRHEIDLVTQVSGKVIRVHPAFSAGGFFEADAVLVVIDPRDYELAVTRAEARLAEAKRVLAQEEAAAEQAEGEWKVLGEGRPTALALHLPQLAAARAGIKAAEADAVEARLNRSRCELRAPFSGRVREKWAGVGQFLSAGDKVARIHSVDVAEVRLPLAPDQIPYLELPGEHIKDKRVAGAKVTLSATFGHETVRWSGNLVRTEGISDEATGLVYVVAEVRQPYAHGPGRPPLRFGSFVQAEIEGRAISGVFTLPHGAVNSAQDAVLVDAANRLQIRHLDVLRTEPGRILIRGGLAPGDRVVVSGVDLPVAGTEVRPQAEELRGADATRAE